VASGQLLEVRTWTRDFVADYGGQWLVASDQLLEEGSVLIAKPELAVENAIIESLDNVFWANFLLVF
jgi:hypothetical protein